MDELQPYIDDCLDLIEFANGPADSKWGKVRASMGHPAPFNMKYIGVGNEQWGELYYERLKPFVAAIRARYPDIKIVGSSGPMPDDQPDNTYRFEDGWKAMRALKADLVDEHYYRDEQWFLSHGLRYDSYDRKGPKVFAGEYACHGKGKKWNHYEAAILEAAHMTGFERNADIVQMATYAPLFAHEEGWQWRPDLIWMDNLKTVRTPNYYVQQMFACNPGTNVLSLTEDKKPVTGQDGLCASAVYDKNTKKYIVKIVNTSNKAQQIQLTFKGLKALPDAGNIQLTTLHSDDPMACNTVQKPNVIVPVEHATHDVTVNKNTMTVQVPARTFALYKF